MRDETDLNGLKLTLDLKRGVDPEKLMAKLYKTTPLEDSFSCNFNVLVSGQPRVMGVREILQEWTAFRMECVRRRTYYDLHGKEKRLHLLKGLAAILLDIDAADAGRLCQNIVQVGNVLFQLFDLTRPLRIYSRFR